MSTLPLSPLPTSTVKVGGKDVPIRSLTRTEAGKMADAADAEVHVLSCGADVTPEEAAAWLDAVDFPTATGLLTAILTLSGLTEAKDESGVPTSGSTAGS